VILQKHQFGTSMPQGGHPPHHSMSSRSNTPSVASQTAATLPVAPRQEKTFWLGCLIATNKLIAGFTGWIP
jgi:hypothetical protein